MKRYDKKGDVETISAKMVYELIESIGESTHKGISVYVTKRDETEDAYRVDCGTIGSFEIRKLQGEEEYDLKYHDWVWVEGVICRPLSYKQDLVSGRLQNTQTIPARWR